MIRVSSLMEEGPKRISPTDLGIGCGSIPPIVMHLSFGECIRLEKVGNSAALCTQGTLEKEKSGYSLVKSFCPTKINLFEDAQYYAEILRGSIQVKSQSVIFKWLTIPCTVIEFRPHMKLSSEPFHFP